MLIPRRRLPTDPRPLSRRIAAHRRTCRASLTAVALAISTTDQTRSRQVVHAWERGALPRPCDLPAIARWMGEDVQRLRRWRRQQLDLRKVHGRNSTRGLSHV